MSPNGKNIITISLTLKENDQGLHTNWMETSTILTSWKLHNEKTAQYFDVQKNRLSLSHMKVAEEKI